MSTLPPLPRDQRKIDQDHVKLLAIFHFVAAGLALFGILFLILHFTIVHTIFADPKIWENQKSGPPPAIILQVLNLVYVVVGAWFLISGILNVISGLCLASRKGRTFSMVVGGINCLHIPLGIVLGVFTLIVLMRDSVRELYETPSRV